jgi:ribulose-phosphate 3-epimerase
MPGPNERAAGTNHTMEIVPSVLPADFSRLGDACASLDAAGADRIQWDVMDGSFVPDITVGAGVVAACRPHTALPFEAHLMVDHPERHLERFADVGCDWIIVHVEATLHPHRTLMAIRDLDRRTGLALNPGTPVEAAEPLLELVDLLLVMTVNPGFGGQAYIPTTERKIAAARRLVDERGLDTRIEVDGGIGLETIGGAAAAGADTFVSGSALWRYDDLGQGVRELRGRAEKGRDGV